MISANYFDGASARMHTVDLELQGGVFALAGADIVKSYQFTEARMAEPFNQAPCVVDFVDGSRCEVSDPHGKSALAAALGYRKSRVVRLQQHWYGALLALVLLLASVAGFVKWGIPALGERIVVALPASVDQRVGDEALRAMRGHFFQPTRLSDQRVAEVREIFDMIKPKTTRIPLNLKLVSMTGTLPNAFALPNGTILMSDQMILHVLGEETDLDDDMKAAIAGVLAHEIGHIQGRHSMRAIVRSSALALGSASLFGDFSAIVASAPVLLMNMDYSRAMETAADDYAIARMDEAGMSTEPLADLFDSMEFLAPGESDIPKWMSQSTTYLRSHPATEERSERLRAGRHYND